MPERATLKEKLAVLLVKSLAALPLSFSRFIGRLIGRLSWWFSKKQVHFSKTNIQHCLPNMSQQKQTELCKASLISSGELVAELSATWLWPAKKILKLPLEIENQQLLRDAYTKQQGVLLLSPHLGNWEMLLPILSQQYEIAAMYKPPRMSKLDELIRAVREKDGAEVFPANASGIRSILKAIKKGKLTLLLPDQEPAKNAGIFTPFFNQPAWTMTLPAKLLQKTKCAVLFSFVVRTKKGFKMIIREVNGINPELSVEEIATLINKGMEKIILEYPTQYQWSYKRFYIQPNDKPQIYLKR